MASTEINPRTGLPAIVAFRTLADGKLAVVTFTEDYPRLENDFDRYWGTVEQYLLIVGRRTHKIPKDHLSKVLESVELYESGEVSRFLLELHK